MNVEDNRQRVTWLSAAILVSVQKLALKRDLTNEQLAHAVLWAAIDLAGGELGPAPVVEWLRDVADRFEAQLLPTPAGTMQ